MEPSHQIESASRVTGLVTTLPARDARHEAVRGAQLEALRELFRLAAGQRPKQ